MLRAAAGARRRRAKVSLFRYAKEMSAIFYGRQFRTWRERYFRPGATARTIFTDTAILPIYARV